MVTQLLPVMADNHPVHALRVTDGDSVTLRLHDRDGYPVRTYRINPLGEDQRADGDSLDHSQRLVGVLYLEGGSVRDSANHAMGESGLAYWCREYGGAELGFDDSERYARRERAGVWGQQGSVMRGAAGPHSRSATAPPEGEPFGASW